MNVLIEQMKRAARLDSSLYEEVEADESATLRAMAVVALAALAAGIGALRLGPFAMVAAVVHGLIGWALSAGVIWLIGTRLLAEPQTRADWAQVARATGYAQAPGLLRVFAFVPLLGPLLVALSGLWMFAAAAVAIRQALDYSNIWRAVAVVSAGMLVELGLLLAFGLSLR